MSLTNITHNMQMKRFGLQTGTLALGRKGTKMVKRSHAASHTMWVFRVNISAESCTHITVHVHQGKRHKEWSTVRSPVTSTRLTKNRTLNAVRQTAWKQVSFVIGRFKCWQFHMWVNDSSRPGSWFSAFFLMFCLSNWICEWVES